MPSSLRLFSLRHLDVKVVPVLGETYPLVCFFVSLFVCGFFCTFLGTLLTYARYASAWRRGTALSARLWVGACWLLVFPLASWKFMNSRVCYETGRYQQRTLTLQPGSCLIVFDMALIYSTLPAALLTGRGIVRCHVLWFCAMLSS